MGHGNVCRNNEVLDLLVDYGKKIYGNSKLKGIEELKDPRDKAEKLWKLLNPEGEEFPKENLQDMDMLLCKLKDKLADRAARVYMEKLINQQIIKKMEQNEKEYIDQIKLQIISKHTDNESPATLKKYAEIEKKKSITLAKQIWDILRPGKADEIIGQAEGVKALLSKIASPYPQHVIIYGPPGVGKTSAARIALEAAKKKSYSPFRKDAPFIEVDGSTIRWDPREAINPLLGSVHDPIYQGARKDLADIGMPEPKLGLVTEAHGGILFIDEIGELDLTLQNKLLKVLEDKKVNFDSSYYDESSKDVPKYIKMLFEEGAPADFILIGATTRRPEEINPALRSRCAEVFFNPLSPKDINTILQEGSKKLKASITKDAMDLISKHVYDGRKAVNILLDCYSECLYENSHVEASIDAKKASIALGHLIDRIPAKPKGNFEIGRIYGIGVSGFVGSIIEFEAISFPVDDKRGSVRFNETAGSMIRDSLFNALTVLKKHAKINPDNFDIHVNCIGGGKVDGPSAGVALTCLLYSAIANAPLRCDCCITGEISISGNIKAVGSVREKVIAAIREGFKHVIIPKENKNDVLGIEGINIIFAGNIKEVMEFLTMKPDEGRGVV